MLTRGENICVGCPAFAGMFAESENSSEEQSEMQAAMYDFHLTLGSSLLDEAAEEVDCKDDDTKQLPPQPNVMPEVGSTELIDYVKACPAFSRYIHKMTAGTLE